MDINVENEHPSETVLSNFLLWEHAEHHTQLKTNKENVLFQKSAANRLPLDDKRPVHKAW